MAWSKSVRLIIFALMRFSQFYWFYWYFDFVSNDFSIVEWCTYRSFQRWLNLSDVNRRRSKKSAHRRRGSLGRRGVRNPCHCCRRSVRRQTTGNATAFHQSLLKCSLIFSNPSFLSTSDLAKAVDVVQSKWYMLSNLCCFNVTSMFLVPS